MIASRCHDQVPEELRDRIAKAIDHEHKAKQTATSEGSGSLGGA